MTEALFSEPFELEQRLVNGVRINFRHNLAHTSAKLPGLLLLHGFPQTHAIWHRVAPGLSQHFRLVLPDLRGYGDSDKPESDPAHATYSKRSMAADNVALMGALGFDTFHVCGHDRGGRVAHRLALDHPAVVRKLMLLDIAPTLTMYEATNRAFAQFYYHWFFLIQPAPMPETLIGADPSYYARVTLGGANLAGLARFDPRALAEYERCIAADGCVHGMCEDYRASATIDLEHDRADVERRIEAPLRVLWAEQGVVHHLCKPIETWQVKARGEVSGRALPTGHFIPEHLPEVLLADMLEFFSA